MGNNAAFSEFEFYVIALYNKGVLDEKLLSTIMERYRVSDIDQGGMEGTLSEDGLNVEEIVLKVFGKKIPERPSLPKDARKWTTEQKRQNDEYWEARYDAFSNISYGKFGWR